MAENSKIQWTTHTFNPWRGCTKVHDGCKNCYAEALSGRNPSTLGKWGPNGTRVVAAEAAWKEPLKWNRLAQCNCGAAGSGDRECAFCQSGGVRPRVFCASLADVFEDWQGPIHDHQGLELRWDANAGGPFIAHVKPDPSRPWTHDEGLKRLTLDDVRRRLFALIDATPNLDWLLLTKRPENVARMWVTRSGENAQSVSIMSYRSNLWLGTSVSDQATADKWIPELLKCEGLCPVRFLSIEPLLGPITLPEIVDCGADGTWCSPFRSKNKLAINWLIVGGESGHNARPCNVEWIRSIVRQCGEASVPCFVKQLGGNVLATNAIDPLDQFPTDVAFEQAGNPDTIRVFLEDKKGGDMAEWPDDLRVRQLPEVRS